MKKLSERYPDDLDAATLYAESVMNLSPWDYWSRDFQPYQNTLEVKRILESVLKRNPNHPGAIHLYIHLVEYARPQLAEEAAGVEKRFIRAWKPADIELTSSRFIDEG